MKNITRSNYPSAVAMKRKLSFTFRSFGGFFFLQFSSFPCLPLTGRGTKNVRIYNATNTSEDLRATPKLMLMVLYNILTKS